MAIISMGSVHPRDAAPLAAALAPMQHRARLPFTQPSSMPAHVYLIVIIFPELRGAQLS